MSKMARTFGTPQWFFFCLLCAQYINVFANIITHHLRVTIVSYFCQRLQQLLSLNVFHHYASRCSRRYMQPGPTHARRKPMQPSGFFYVSCVLNILMFLQTSSRTPCAPQLRAILANVCSSLCLSTLVLVATCNLSQHMRDGSRCNPFLFRKFRAIS